MNFFALILSEVENDGRIKIYTDVNMDYICEF